MVDLVILVGHLVLVDHSIVDLEILVVLVVALDLLDALVDPININIDFNYKELIIE